MPKDIHAKRVTIMPKDIRLAHFIRGERAEERFALLLLASSCTVALSLNVGMMESCNGLQLNALWLLLC
jgi:hypothetical protein